MNFLQRYLYTGNAQILGGKSRGNNTRSSTASACSLAMHASGVTA
jgi:hypothetical protein